jgi:1,4-alpha-glucan branching enzyme
MPGDEWQRFANLRAYYGFMFTHPGKKLLFMGAEFAQVNEWSHEKSLDWHLLDHPLHQGAQHLVRDLNRLYREVKALHRRDSEPEGFQWLKSDDAEKSVLAYARFGSEEDAPAITLCNFTPLPRQGYRIGAPKSGRWREALNTDARIYGGSNLGNQGQVTTDGTPYDGFPDSMTLTLPPLATVVLIWEKA